jgi:hypothetical protein
MLEFLLEIPFLIVAESGIRDKIYARSGPEILFFEGLLPQR